LASKKDINTDENIKKVRGPKVRLLADVSAAFDSPLL
jgi:hypothetical protein